MTRQLLGVLAALAALLSIGVTPASAITGGRPDGAGHPYVGMVVTDTGEVCSGTLMSPTVFLTAGHCTLGATRAGIWFGSGPLDPSIPADATGSPRTAVDYAFPYRDLGVVLLSEPYQLPEYGVLPGPNELDSLKTERGLQDRTFTTIGYGMQKSFPDAAAWKDVYGFTRMTATPHLVQIDGGVVGDFGMVLSNNASTGGVCFGDSGGPNLIGSSNVVAGVTVALANPTCAGTGTVLRLDRPWSLEWLATFGVTPPTQPS